MFDTLDSLSPYFILIKFKKPKITSLGLPPEGTLLDLSGTPGCCSPGLHSTVGYPLVVVLRIEDPWTFSQPMKALSIFL